MYALHASMEVLNNLSALSAAVPDPGQGEAPPGSEGLLRILRWAAFVALVACVLGVIVCGALMALQHQRGGGGEHANRLGMVMAGAIIIGSASALITAVL